MKRAEDYTVYELIKRFKDIEINNIHKRNVIRRRIAESISNPEEYLKIDTKLG